MNIDAGTIQFLEHLNDDDALRSQLESALEGAEDKTGAVMTFAASKGFEIDREGFDTARAALAGATSGGGALDDGELDAVAGGFNPQPEPPARVSGLAARIRFNPRTLLGW